MRKNSIHPAEVRLLVFVSMVGMAWAAEPMPAVKDLILPKIEGLAAPSFHDSPSGIVMAVSTAEPQAQKHVLHGFNLMHGGWDFEAYRHFIAALEIDPECLMAHFGVMMSMLETDAESVKPRMAAADRALGLIQQGKGTAHERGYLYAVKQLFDEGPSAAADAFADVSRKYPNDIQLKLFQAYFRRTGFDEYGSPKPDQRVAQEQIQALMKLQPNSPLLMHSWLMLRAENLEAAQDLPMARRLCELVSDYPPYHHLLGHYEWRCGNYREACAAFSRCGVLYREWMEKSGVGITECPEWIRAEVYRIVSLASTGDYDSAYAAAQALRKISIPPDRLKSAGACMIAWEVATLEARIRMVMGGKENLEIAMKSLPSKEHVKAMSSYSRVAFFYQGLAMVIQGQLALAENDLKRAQEIEQALGMHMPLMEKVRRDAVALGELSGFVRAYHFMEIAIMQLKGDVVMRKPEGSNSSAYNWYSSARERQAFATRMMPPIFLRPMQASIGRYYEEKKDFAQAKDTYQEGLKYWPRNLTLLHSLLDLQVATKDDAGAQQTKEWIDSAKREN